MTEKKMIINGEENAENEDDGYNGLRAGTDAPYDPEMIPTRSHNDPSPIPTWSRPDPNMIPTRSQHDPIDPNPIPI